MTTKRSCVAPVRIACVLALAGLAAVPLASQHQGQTARPERLNVLFLIADDLNTDLGASLAPVLADPARTVKDAAFTQVRRGELHGYSIRTDRWRYTAWDEGRQGEQLYDMAADPGETTNLASDPQWAATIAELRARLRDYATPARTSSAPAGTAASPFPGGRRSGTR